MAWTICWKCNERFGLADETEALLRRSGQAFHCPWGHSAVFKSGPTEADKARKEADDLRRERDRLKQNEAYLQSRIETADRSAAAYRGQVTKLKNRASAGVCPCCNRTFANMARHMASQHKGFTAEEVAPEGVTVQ